MKLKNCYVENFGSYRSFEIDFSSRGLSLLHGKTGSGKSTIPDMPCWILYGNTAKNGNADDVKSWTADDAPTKGVLSVELVDGREVEVTRIRGKSNENDLFWRESDSPSLSRGKDITDSQKLLDSLLGISFEVYVSGSYYHEFSPTGSFFSANARQRREVFEGLASLETATHLSEKATKNKKLLKDSICALYQDKNRLEGITEELGKRLDSMVLGSKNWDANQEETIKILKAKAQSFEKDKESKLVDLIKKDRNWLKQQTDLISGLIKQLDGLNGIIVQKNTFDVEIAHTQAEIEKATDSRCPTCNGPKASDSIEQLRIILTSLNDKKKENINSLKEFDRIYDRINNEGNLVSPFIDQIKQLEDQTNIYEEHYIVECSKPNPFASEVERVYNKRRDSESGLLRVSTELAEQEHRYNSLDTLYDLSYELRGALLFNAVRKIEAEANFKLESHFDAELRVSFTLEGADNLEVGITKNGHSCSYRQLSKGQRQLLKLSFVTSVMESSANKIGQVFNVLFFDEALDGLDSDLKIKAYSLFEVLNMFHESIFLIDHNPEFQTLFSNKYHVTMENDLSSVECRES